MSSTVPQSNMLALGTLRTLRESSRARLQPTFRLATGQRINTAADDPTGLAISERMRSQIRGLDMASRNIQNASSMVQTAEWAMATIVDLLSNLRELVVQAANDTLEHEHGIWQSPDRERIQVEINSLLDEIDRVRNTSEFNRIPLIDGTWARYRHESNWFAFRGHPGRPGTPDTPGTPGWTELPAPTLRNVLGEGYVHFLPNTHRNTIARLDVMGSQNPGFSIIGNNFQWASNVMQAADRSVRQLIGYTSGAPFTGTQQRHDAAESWLISEGVNLSEISSLHELLNGWQVLDSSLGADTLRAQQMLWEAILETDLGNYVGPYTGDPIVHPSIPGIPGIPHVPSTPGSWIEELNRFPDPNRPLFFQVGANADQSIRLHIEDMAVSVLGLDFLRNAQLEEGRGVMRRSGAAFQHGGSHFLDRVDRATSYVNQQRSLMGAMENRLQHAYNFAVESSAIHVLAESRIRDADMALEGMRLARADMVQNVSTMFMAQANQRPNMVLSLLDGVGSVISQVASSRNTPQSRGPMQTSSMRDD